jgi:hypothetical protein
VSSADAVAVWGRQWWGHIVRMQTVLPVHSKNLKNLCVNDEIYHTGMDMCSCFRIICLAYVVYVRANRGWRLWSSMIIVYRFGIEKVVSYDFIILIDCDRMYQSLMILYAVLMDVCFYFEDGLLSA